MSAIDTLQILVEADSSGLQTQLKKAGSTITNFVSSMNKQEVNWTNILSRSISPAIIAGIASTFALAIGQALNFTNAMGQAAANSSQAFTSNLAGAGQAALDIQAQTGQSASAIASSMGIATQALGNYAAGQALVTQASKIALVTGIPLATLVQKLTSVFTEWGINTAPEVTQGIINLFGAAQQGRVPLQQLLDVMAQTGAALQGKTSIDEAAASLEALSNQSGMTADAASKIFIKLSDGFVDFNQGILNSTVGIKNMDKTIKESGMAGIIGQLEKYMNGVSEHTAQIMGNNAGFDKTTIAHLKLASENYKTIGEDTDIIVKNMALLGERAENTLTPTMKIRVAWSAILSDLTKLVAQSGLLDFIATGLENISAAIQNPKQILGEMLKAAAETAIKFSPMGNFVSGAENLFNKISGNKGSSNTPAGPSVINNSTINYNISPHSIGGQSGAGSQGLDAQAYQQSQM